MRRSIIMPDNLPDIIIDDNLKKLGIEEDRIRGYEIMKYVWKYIKDNNLNVKRA